MAMSQKETVELLNTLPLETLDFLFETTTFAVVIEDGRISGVILEELEGK